MKRSPLLLLAALAAVAIVLSMLGRSPERQSDSVVAERLYPQLAQRLNEVSRVEISGPGGARTSMQRQEDRWVVLEREGYPAQVGRLRDLLLTLAEASLVEAKTAQEELYERLGLQGFGAEDAPTRRIRLWVGEQVLADLWVGDRRLGESFVRREGEDQTWLVSGRLELNANPADWLPRELLGIERARVRSVAVQPTESAAYRLERDSKDAEFAMPDLDAGRQLAQSAVRRLAGALQDQRLSDVRRIGAAQADAEAAQVLTRYETFDGTVVEARVRKQDDRYYVRYQLGRAQASGESDESAQADLAAELERLRARVDGWEFELNGYDGGSLTLLRADLVQDKPAE